jgi:hypothetical protein
MRDVNLLAKCFASGDISSPTSMTYSTQAPRWARQGRVERFGFHAKLLHRSEHRDALALDFSSPSVFSVARMDDGFAL